MWRAGNRLFPGQEHSPQSDPTLISKYLRSSPFKRKVCVWGGGYTTWQAHMEARVSHLVSSPIVHLCFWDTVSHWVWSSLFSLNCMTSKTSCVSGCKQQGSQYSALQFLSSMDPRISRQCILPHSAEPSNRILDFYLYFSAFSKTYFIKHLRKPIIDIWFSFLFFYFVSLCCVLKISSTLNTHPLGFMRSQKMRNWQWRHWKS